MKHKYNISDNAGQILQNFRESCSALAKSKKIHVKKFNIYLDEIITEALKGYESVDAEILMTELNKIGKVEEVVQSYGKNFPGEEKTSGIRKLHLSSKDRVLGGVCGGIAEYFKVDTLLIRAGFIAGFFLAGITLFLYVILWLAMHERDKIKSYPPLVAIIFEVLQIAKMIVVPIVSSILQRPLKAEAKTSLTNSQETVEGTSSQTPKKKGIIRRFFSLIFFVFLSAVVYLPIFCILLAIASFCIWGTFYPILSVDGFHFSFAALETPGMVTGISIAALAFFLFLLFAHIMVKVHLKSKILSKNTLVLVCILSVISIFSSGSGVFVTAFQNKAQETITTSRDFEVNEEQIIIAEDQLESLNHLAIKLDGIVIYGEKERKNITVKATLAARGENETQAKENVRNIELEWAENKVAFIPKVIKADNEFHFENVKIEVFVPTNKAVTIEGVLRSRLLIKGDFKENINLNVRNTHVIIEENNIQKLILQSEHSHIDIKNSSIAELTAHLERSHTSIEATKIENCSLYSENSHVRMDHFAGNLKVENNNGRMHVENSNGTLNMDNYKGKIKFIGFDFEEKSENFVNNNDGFVEMLFSSKNLPKMETQNEFGRIHNRIPHFATIDAIVKLNNKHGKIILDTKRIRSRR